MRNGQRCDRAAQTLTDPLGRCHIGIRQQDRECPAAVAGDQIAVARDVAGETCRDGDQALVALGLAMAVVEILEAIDVDHQHG